MPTFTTPDGIEMYYTEQGEGQPIVFAHGWPLSSDAWQPELKFFSENGYRAIAHDRRGHGRSEKTAVGHTIDQYAKDLAALIEHLDLHDVIVMGHSTGGGEVVKYAAQYANGRVAKVITAGAIPPIMVKSDSNPDGTPDRRLRRHPRRRPRGRVAVLARPVRVVLRGQPRPRRLLRREARLLASGPVGEPLGRL
ncbi:alpha/beta hydrolase [Curtobacterium sp. SORGH_AS_0776]|uniref:alpha/beta fold hydrolase n=1 Tax=Curtobacterium sp. SORGH_AS_0776 TaxID=3041798 RepID=UPI00285A6982|nr:alpha/beta hydrolase [Curtobacterium sp. SORGH_AS_0776]MDR6170479.1 pimeloyl-ACP methyl ester carboxylesterase [Curtobacterium sp. SORGH_AS_0776]